MSAKCWVAESPTKEEKEKWGKKKKRKIPGNDTKRRKKKEEKKKGSRHFEILFPSSLVVNIPFF
jgi:hypothetical protein